MRIETDRKEEGEKSREKYSGEGLGPFGGGDKEKEKEDQKKQKIICGRKLPVNEAQLGGERINRGGGHTPS